MMLGYSLVLGVHRATNHTVLMEQRVLDTLGHYFEDFDPSPVGSMDEVCENTFPWESFVFNPQMLAEERFRIGGAIE